MILKSNKFVSFVSLIPYHRILKLLKAKKINSKISVKDALLQLSKIYLTDIGERTAMAEISTGNLLKPWNLNQICSIKMCRVNDTIITGYIHL